MQQLPYSDILLQLLHAGTYDLEILSKMKKEFASVHKLSDIPTNIQLLKVWREMKSGKLGKLSELNKLSKLSKMSELSKEDEKKLMNLLKKRGIRSQSGIVSVQVLTKPWPCPGKCIFCPNEKGMPKSYISSEPGAMRAALNKFDPIKQVYNRLHSLFVTGHETDKIEMIVLGGTFDSYTKEYKIKFVKELYDAANTFSKLKVRDEGRGMGVEEKYRFEITNLKTIKYSKTLAEAMKKNETAKHRIIGLTIETRPEFVIDENCQFWRELGVTRIEMGVQSLDDEVLKANKRGNMVEQIRRAFDTMRRRGFKISVHIMPGLYTSNYAKDLKTFVDLYKDPFLKPDEIKFYPTSVIPHTKLAELYKKGEYTPLETEDIKKLIRQVFLEIIPPYTRIKRLIRDIPANEIMAGSKITNLGQLMHTALLCEMRIAVTSKELRVTRFYERLRPNVRVNKSLSQLRRASFPLSRDAIQTLIIGQKPNIKTFRNFVCLDTRSREIRNRTIESWNDRTIEKQKILLVIRRYVSSVGMEYFISYEDQLGYLYGFARLTLLTNPPPRRFGVPLLSQGGQMPAMIRELHVYGNVEALNIGSRVEGREKGSDIQHTGFGKRLMEVAETLAKKNGFKKIAVISGVGVRGYYKKLGYKLSNTYMVKNL